MGDLERLFLVLNRHDLPGVSVAVVRAGTAAIIGAGRRAEMGLANLSTAKFLKNFLTDRRVGAVAPTSSYTIRRLCERIALDHARVIVDYGPGTGVFAEFLLERMPAESKLIMIETNPGFCEMLRRLEDPRAHVFNNSAENVRDVLSRCDEDAADCIISGIPFTFLGERSRRRVLENTHKALTENGRFFVYQYSTFMKKQLRDYFGQVRVNIELLNIPPMFIMEAVG